MGWFISRKNKKGQTLQFKYKAIIFLIFELKYNMPNDTDHKKIDPSFGGSTGIYPIFCELHQDSSSYMYRVNETRCLESVT